MGNTCGCCSVKVKERPETTVGENLQWNNNGNGLQHGQSKRKNGLFAGTNVKKKSLKESKRNNGDSSYKADSGNKTGQRDKNRSLSEIDPSATHEMCERDGGITLATQVSPMDMHHHLSPSDTSNVENHSCTECASLSTVNTPTTVNFIKIKFVTKGLGIPVYMLITNDEESLLGDYEKKLKEVTSWLSQHEQQVDDACSHPVPIEPSALLEQVKLADELLAEADDGRELVDGFAACTKDLQSCPSMVYQHLEREETLEKKLDGATQKYDALVGKAQNLSERLQATLEQAKDVSEKLEKLLKKLESIRKEYEESKDATSASCSNVKGKIEKMQEFEDSLDKVGSDVEELRQQCVHLFGSGGADAGSSLKKRMDGLVALHTNLVHDVKSWHSHLDEALGSLETFENNCSSCEKVLSGQEVELRATEVQNDKSGEDRLEEVNQQLVSIEDKLKEAKMETLVKRQDVTSGAKLLDQMIQFTKNWWKQTRTKFLKRFMDKVQTIDQVFSSEKAEYQSAINVGEELLVSCRFDSSPVTEALAKLKSSWSEAEQKVCDKRQALSKEKEELERLLELLLKLRAWMAKCWTYLSARIKSVRMKKVNEDLGTTESFLEDVDEFKNQPKVTALYSVSLYLEDHLMNGDRVNGCTEISDARKSLADISSHLMDVKKDLTSLSSRLGEIESMFASFGSVVERLEAEEETWQSKLSSAQLDLLQQYMNEHSEWRGSLQQHSPAHDQLNTSVTVVLHSYQDADGADELKARLDDITSRWNRLLRDAKQQVQLLQKKCDSQSKFIGKHERFDEWLQDKRTIMDMLKTPCSDVASLENRATQLKALEKDVENHKSSLSDLEHLSSELPELCEQYDQLSQRWKALSDELRDMDTKNAESIAKLKSIQAMVEEIVRWSDTMCEDLAATKIGEPDNFKQHFDKIERTRNGDLADYNDKAKSCRALMDELLSLGLVSQDVMKKASSEVDAAMNQAEKALDELESRLRKLEESIREMRALCSEISAWTEATCERVESTVFKPDSVDVSDLRSSLKCLEELLKEADSLNPKTATTSSLLDSVKQQCDCDDRPFCFVSETLSHFVDFVQEMKEMQQSMEERLEQLSKFDELAQSTTKALDGAAEQMEFAKQLSGLTEKQQHLYKEVERVLEKEAQHVAELCDFAKVLSRDTVDDACPSSGTTPDHVSDTANEISQRYRDLKAALTELKVASDQLAQFEGSFDAMSERLHDLENKLDTFEPVARDEKLTDQLDQSLSALQSGQDLLRDVDELRSTYAEHCATQPGITYLEKDIKTVVRSARRLVDAFQARHDTVESTLERLSDFNKSSDRLCDKLASVMDNVKARDEISGNAYELRKLQSELQDLRRSSLSQLHSDLTSVSNVGCSLIYTAHPSVPTHHIQKKINQMEQMWFELNQWVTDYDQRLQKCLINSGHWDDVYSSLSSWLDDAEALVAKQQHPSWEYLAVTMQLKEHKAVEQMFRKEHEMMLAFVQEVASSNTKKSDEIWHKIDDLKKRWDSAWIKITGRTNTLTCVTAEAGQFQATCKSIQDWLDKMDKQSADVIFAGSVKDRIENEIEHQQALKVELDKHEPMLAEIERTPLKERMADDETLSQSLDNHIEGLKTAFEQLRFMILGRCKILKDNKNLAHLFTERMLNLFAFLAENKLKMSRWLDENGNISLIDARPVCIRKVLQACKLILEQLNAKYGQLDEAVKQGREFLTKCPGDDTQSAHEKLDNLALEFSILTKSVETAISKLKVKLEVSEKLEETEKQFSESMSSWNKRFAELDVLRKINISDLSGALQESQPARFEEPLKVIKSSVSSLTSVSMWWGAHVLKNLYKQCDAQHAALLKSIDQHKVALQKLLDALKSFHHDLKTSSTDLEQLEAVVESFCVITALTPSDLSAKRADKKTLRDLAKKVDLQAADLDRKAQAVTSKVTNPHFSEIEAALEAYQSRVGAVRSTLTGRVEKVSAGLSMCDKWNEAREALKQWFATAAGELDALRKRSSNAGVLDDNLLALKNLGDKHAEHKPLVETLNKIKGDLPSLLEESGALNELAEETDACTEEYAKISERIGGQSEQQGAVQKQFNTLEHLLSMRLDALRDLDEQLRQLEPVPLENECLKHRTLRFQEAVTDGGKSFKVSSSIKENVEALKRSFNSLGYVQLCEELDEKFKRLESLENTLFDFATEQLSLLSTTSRNVYKFGEDADEYAQKIDDLVTSLDSLEIHSVLNPEQLSEQAKELEDLAEAVFEMGNCVDELKTRCDQCKAVKLYSGHDSSYIDRKLHEVQTEMAKLQEMLDKRRAQYNSSLEFALKFQKSSSEIEQLLSDTCGTIDALPTVANDVNVIKKQIEELKDIRAESTPLLVRTRNLCSEGRDVLTLHGPVNDAGDVTKLDDLCRSVEEKLFSRQAALDQALISVGQLRHAMDELSQWMNSVQDSLVDQRASIENSSNDSKKLENELTKLKLTTQDILAHAPAYESITSAEFLSGVDKSDNLLLDVESTKAQWKSINGMASELADALQSVLDETQLKESELEDLNAWIDDKRAELSASTFLGGLPETAQQQLDAHLSFMEELEAKQSKLDQLRSDLNHQDGDEIQQKMQKLTEQAKLHQTKLENALKEAKNFHERLESFLSWLGNAEKRLDASMESPHTILYPEIAKILEDRKAFENDVTSMRPEVLELDRLGSHIKYFAQKQDGILVKNLLLTVHARWDKLLSGTVSHSLVVADEHKKSKQFHDGYEKLREWIASASQQLETSQKDNYVDAPDAVEAAMETHKEFQRALGEKQPVYEGVHRCGIALGDKAHLSADVQEIESKLKKLKQSWNSLNSKSVRRKHQLEESLLFSGRFSDAIESLMQWLYKIEPQLSDETPVMGDIHTVNTLMDRHDILHNEFNARQANVDALKQTIDKGQGDSWVSDQLQDLLVRWNAVAEKIDAKQVKLDKAHMLAEDLQSSAQALLENLSTAEKKLQLNQNFPDDEFQLHELRAGHQVFTKDLQDIVKKRDDVVQLADSILNHAHPDAHTPLRQLITVIEAKCAEVLTKSDEYAELLNESVKKLQENTNSLKELEKWLLSAEDKLRQIEQHPDTEDDVDKLLNEHQAFQEEMLSHQPEYEHLMGLYSKRKNPPSTKKKGDAKKSPRDERSPLEELCDSVHSQWSKVWLMALERERKLREAKENIRRNEQLDNFAFEEWRKRYMKWMKSKRARVMDFFRSIDKDGSGQIPRRQFIDEIIKSKFPTNEVEMSRVADVFDQDGDGFIDYYEFVAALYPARDSYKAETDADKIDDEVVRQVAKCTCCKKFKVEQIAENKYKFGDNQQLRLVRILRSTVMVRVGGGWMALDEFLVKNDPCRAKGRTNTELREKFILPSGASQSMTPFKTKRYSTDRTPRRSTDQISPSPSRSSTPVLSTRTKSSFTAPSRKTYSPSHSSNSSLNSSRSDTPKRPSRIPTKETTPKRH